MADLTVVLRSICFLVVPNWFLCTDAVNDDKRVFKVLLESPPIVCM